MDANTFLQRMAQRDTRVFKELMPLIRRLALSACHKYRIADHHQREDIVQEVALRVFRNWQAFRGDSQLGTWIYAIATRQCLDFLRQARRASDTAPLDEGDEGAFDPVDAGASDPAQAHCVQAVLAELSREPPARAGSVRKLDLLVFWVEHGPTTEELAQFLKTTVSAAKERKRYLWAHLKTLCRKHCGTDECGMEQGARG